MKTVKQVNAFICGECDSHVEVWASNKSRDVGALCCGQRMRPVFTEYPQAVLDSMLAGHRILGVREAAGWNQTEGSE